MPNRVQLVHWKEAEAQGRIARLRAAGYEVAYAEATPDLLHAVKERPPDAVVIDLSRLPSHGRELALFLRQQKRTRRIPLVFVDGDPENVARTRKVLPDAVYTTWSRIRGALGQAIVRPPENPVVPPSVMAGYSGTPLPKKLGVQAGSTVALLGVPAGWEAALGELPEGARLVRRGDGKPDLTLWFVRSRKDLARGMARAVRLAASGGVWMVWPKKASGVASDLSEPVVRAAGLAAGLVDYKICAVDATWSGLKFALRKPTR